MQLPPFGLAPATSITTATASIAIVALFGIAHLLSPSTTTIRSGRFQDKIMEKS